MYLGDGAQIVPPDDAHIAAAIDAVAARPTPLRRPPPGRPDEIIEAYLAAVADPLQVDGGGRSRSCTRRSAV